MTRTFFRTLNLATGPLLELGVGNPLPLGAGPVMVETEGRKSGTPRRVPLLSTRLGSTVFVSTVRPNSQWIKNLAAKPDAKVRLFGTDYAATARVRNLGPFSVATLQIQD